jgi:hypothetical protein
MTQLKVTATDRGLLQRVCGEYIEMPGLRLTTAQACRLWNVDAVTGQTVLNRLVDERFLRVSGPHYVKAGSGRLCA